MIINRNSLGHLEVPAFILMKASGERVGILQCTAKSWTEKFNDLDMLTFEVPYMIDAVPTNFYDDIDIMKYVEVPTIGTFAIKAVNILNEGKKTEIKKVECQSRECELGQKYLEEFIINQGTTGSIDGVKFYNPADQPHSLLHLAVKEKCPGWNFGHISVGLQTMQRSFEVTRQDIYSFLMSDVAKAFECIFVFDTTSKTISAYEETEYGVNTNISVSYNNLLQNTSMDYSIDEVKTCLTLKGDSDLDIREIAMGYDRIYSFEAFASTDYWSQGLLTAYRAWQTLMDSAVDTSLFTYKAGVITAAELQGKSYKDAFSYLLNKYQEYYIELGEWYNTKLPYGINTRKNPGYGTISFTEDGADAVTFEKQTSTQLVTSLPSTKDRDTLYILSTSNIWAMYRWTGSVWVNVNEWRECALAELKSLQASAEKLQAVAMKAGYGESESKDTTIQKRYVDTYLPAYYMYNALTKQIAVVNDTISNLEGNQAIIEKDKNIITEKTAMTSNFTTAQLTELSTFIREEELSSENYVVTDVMTEEERFEMLYDLLSYGEKELAKVSTPQIQFSANLINLFAIPEFDNYSGNFDIGNYVWVTIRDDYSIKARILEITLNLLDQSEFNVTFGNVVRKARNMFTDVTDALNAATAAATSVSFSASHWSASAEQTDAIGDALRKGLLSQQYYLTNAEDNEFLVDENGVWITTTTGAHGRDNTDDYDGIYLGGGRILYTDDGWRTVSMSVGRGDVDYPSINNVGQLVYTTESRFGVFADYLIAGYVGGSIIAGGDIYSANYQTSSSKTSGNRGTHINLTDGTFEFNSKTTGKKRLILSSDTLEVYGTIQASSGHIGCDDNGTGGFIIDSNKIYNGKSSLNANSNGVFVGTDGIGLGQLTTYDSTGGSVYRSLFEVDSAGTMYAGSVNIKGHIHATSGYIGDKANGFNITSTAIYNNKSSMSTSSKGVYVGTDGIALGTTTSYSTGSGTITKSKFEVDSSGNLYASSANISGRIIASSGTIGGFNIGTSSIYNGKTTISDSNNGVYIGTNGIGLGPSSEFKVDSYGHLTASSATITGTVYADNGTVGGAYISNSAIYASNGNWSINSDGSAYFKNIAISGTATFGSNTSNPFSGTCISHIKNISADYIYGEYIEGIEGDIDYITSNYVKTDYLEANYLTAGEIDATYVTTDHLTSNYLTAREIEASYVSSYYLEANYLTAREIDASYATIRTLEAVNAKFQNLNASNITSGTMSTDYLSFDGYAIGRASGYVIQSWPLHVVIDGVTYNVGGSSVNYFNFMGHS